MKRFAFILVLLACASPAWCAKKVTVAELGEMLRSFQQDKKNDTDVAAALKQVELSEELTRPAMNSFAELMTGPLSTEQMYILEARSATLAPPPSDLPPTPAPGADQQKSILARAEQYLTTYEQLPVLSATKTTLRFQDNYEALSASSGLAGGAQEVVTNAGFSSAAAFVHYIGSTARDVTLEHGAEKKPAQKDSTPWGANKMIAVQEPDPGLGKIFSEAQASGSLQWLRWETIYGKPAAVFSFAVPKQKSRLDVNVCCFPNINQTGKANFYTATTAATLGGGAGGGGGGATGNFQTHTEWRDFKSTVPYHGRVFIDPGNGIILRMIIEAELKPSDMVHQLDTRIDFGPVKAGQGTIIAPIRSVINSVVVPNGEAQAGGYKTRCTLFTSDYTDYRIGASR
ncbi:MAG TPA: hypothetical protein VFD98_09765 [Terracidiphilus sp.]|nr:hypothetical protein [Terracidiphilus sp.]